MANEDNKEQVNLQIGQIVYILSDKAEAIVPAIVAEELVHKKLDGNSVSWKVAIGPPSKKKIISSGDISGEIYSSLEEVKTIMMERFSMFVNSLINKAEKRTETWYGKQIAKSKSLKQNKSGKIDPSALLDIIDGRENGKEFREHIGEEIVADANNNISNLKIPINSGPLLTNKINSRDELRNKLRELATPEANNIDDKNNVVSGNGNEFLVTEDGRKIPIKFNINE